MKKHVFLALVCCGAALLTGCASTPDNALLPDASNRSFVESDAKAQECTLPSSNEKNATQEHFMLEQKMGDLGQKIEELKTVVAKKEDDKAQARKNKYLRKHKRKPCNCSKDAPKKDESKKTEPKKSPEKAA